MQLPGLSCGFLWGWAGVVGPHREAVATRLLAPGPWGGMGAACEPWEECVRPSGQVDNNNNNLLTQKGKNIGILSGPAVIRGRTFPSDLSISDSVKVNS